MLRCNNQQIMLRHHLLLVSVILLITWLCLPEKITVSASQELKSKVTLSQQIRPEVNSASLIAPVEENTSMQLTLALNLRNPLDLDKFLAELHDTKSPNYQRWISPNEFGERFGVDKTEYQAMVSWLESEGFIVDRTWPNRLAINFSGTVAKIEKTFQLQINRYQYSERQYFANNKAPQIPARFASNVLTVLGLENFSEPEPLHKKLANIDKSNSSKDSALTFNGRTALAPKDFQIAYNTAPLIAEGIDGTGQEIAIAARSDFNVSDVQKFRSDFGLTANDPKKVFPFGPVANRGGIEETEVLLDVQLSGATAPKANVQAIIAPMISQSLQAIYNDFSSIPIVSLSFGLCEQRLMLESTMFFNSLYAQGVAQGQTTFVASGDDGANDCRDGRLAVNGLASSPNVVAVGGTRLDARFDTNGNATAYGGEVVWNTGRGSGGGLSTVFDKPAYQVGPGVANSTKRNVPDVALMADPIGPGYFIVQSGITTTIGGTSASAPSWAGILALVQQRNQNIRLGNANFRIYALGSNQAAGGPKVFNDVTVGNNSVANVMGFNAQTNYDLATGWGSVNASELARNLFTQQNPFQTVRNLQATAQGTDKVMLNWQVPANFATSSKFAKPVLDLAKLEQSEKDQYLLDPETNELKAYRFGIVRSGNNEPNENRQVNEPNPLASGQAPRISQLIVDLKGKNKAKADFTVTDPDGDLGRQSGVSIILLDKDVRGVTTPRNGNLLLFGDRAIFSKPLDFTGKETGNFPFTLKGVRGFPSAAIWASSIRDDAGILNLAPAVTGINGRVAGDGTTPMIMNANAAIFNNEDSVGVNLDGIDDDANTAGMTLGFLDANGKVVFALGIVGDGGLQNFSPFSLELVRNPVRGQARFNVNFSISGVTQAVRAGTLKAVSVSLVDSNGNQSAVRVIPLDGVASTNNLLRYNIYRSQTTPVLLAPTNLIGIVPATNTTFTDSVSITQKTTFNYVVTAVYENGESPASNEVIVTIDKP